MSSRSQHKEATRQAIVDAALRLSAERGFASVSLRSVAAEAGIAPATFYRHFSSVDDLGLALVDQIGMSLRRLVREARQRVGEARGGDVVAVSLETFLDYARSNPNLFRLLLGEGAGNTRELRRALVKEIDRFADDLAEYLELEAQGNHRPLRHAREAAEAMVTVAFNLGVASLDLRPEERQRARERILLELRMILSGAQTLVEPSAAATAGWSTATSSLEELAASADESPSAGRVPRWELGSGAPGCSGDRAGSAGGFRFGADASCSVSSPSAPKKPRKMPVPPPHSETLVEILRERAREAPDRKAFSYLEDGEEREAVLSYGELDRRARAIAARLQQDHEVGDRVLLLYPPGLDFVTAFYACSYAGVIAVPAYPPDPTRLDRTLPRVQAILSDCGARTVLTTSPIQSMAGFLFPKGALSGLAWLASDQIEKGPSEGWREPAVDGDAVAFLQYTSGSTGSPKGVVITHTNVLVNQEMMRQVSGSSDQSVVLSWVPFYHDLGLIGGVVHPVYVGGRSVLMSPLDFLQKPARWLRAVTRHRATISAGPNFAFELCARRVSAPEREGLDLSSWSMALVGAEPIAASTLERFTQEFAPHGFDPAAFFQGYGMAEAVLSVSSGTMGVVHRTVEVDKRDLRRNVVTVVHRSRSQRGDRGERAAEIAEIVSCGKALPGQDIRVVDPESGTPKGEREIGEVWVRGDNVARGYWNRDEDSARTFGGFLRLEDADRTSADVAVGPFLRSGDLAFWHDGELYVTGRIKDLIILRGRNIYPQDLEASIERSHPALRPGCGAAFSVQLPSGEALVVAQEVRKDLGGADLGDVAAAIRRTLLREEGLRCHAVVLLQAGTIPKTSSGKIRRGACREAFLDGTLEVVATDVQTVEETASSLLTLEQLMAHPEDARRNVLAESLREAIAKALDASPSEIDMSAPLAASGVDSVAIMNLAHDIEARLSVELDFDLLLGGATPDAIAGHILDEVSGVPARA